MLSSVKQIAKLVNKNSKKILITKSTVPVGTGDNIENILKRLKKKLEVISNPEFLRRERQ